MHFFFAKLFDEYRRKNDPAAFNITLYISFVYLLALFSIYLPMKEIAFKKYNIDWLEYNETNMLITIFLIFAIIIGLVYVFYVKNRVIYTLSERFKMRQFNRVVLYILIPAIPLVLLFLGAIITVLLKGGAITGENINGVFKNK